MATKRKKKKKILSEEERLTPYRKGLVEKFWGNDCVTVYTIYETFKRPKEELLKSWHEQMICRTGKKL